ncbi:hypothetical protein AB0I72_07665 [Nocardiopsis sp. NPDC049922]
MLGGLRLVLDGGEPTDGESETARRFLGWSSGGHWILGQRR